MTNSSRICDHSTACFRPCKAKLAGKQILRHFDNYFCHFSLFKNNGFGLKVGDLYMAVLAWKPLNFGNFGLLVFSIFKKAIKTPICEPLTTQLASYYSYGIPCVLYSCKACCLCKQHPHTGSQTKRLAKMPVAVCAIFGGGGGRGISSKCELAA